MRRLRGPLLALATAGVATAWYSVSGATGTGSATPLDTSATLTLTANGVVSGGLYPGGPGADVTVSVTNPYAHPVTLTAATGTVAVSCTTPDVTLATPGGLPVTVPASATTPVTLTGLVAMGTGAGNDCQGATVTVTFRLTGRLS